MIQYCYQMVRTRCYIILKPVYYFNPFNQVLSDEKIYCFLISITGPTILDVLQATKHVTEWNVLAYLLKLSKADVESIMSTAHGPSQPQKSIISKWLESGTASWAALATALKHDLVGQGATANNIAKNYPKGRYYSAISIDRYMLNEKWSVLFLTISKHIDVDVQIDIDLIGSF